MPPHVRAHHFIVDGVAEQRGLRLAAQHVIHELQLEFLRVDLRDRVDGVSAQGLGLLAPVGSQVIVRTDDEVVLGIAAVLHVLLEVLHHGDLRVVVIARDAEHGNADAREVAFVRHHGLPVPVVGRMREPALQQRVRRAIDGVDLAKRPPAREPVARQVPPALVVGIQGLVEQLVVGDVERPGVVSIQEHVVVHRQPLAGDGRRRHRDALERRMFALGGRPCGESRVAPTDHAYLAVAPRLLDDPVEHGMRVDGLVLVRHRRIGAQALAARVRDDAGIASRGEFLGLGLEHLRIGVDVEYQDGWYAAFGARIRQRQRGRERDALVFDQHVLGVSKRHDPQKEGR